MGAAFRSPRNSKSSGSSDRQQTTGRQLDRRPGLQLLQLGLRGLGLPADLGAQSSSKGEEQGSPDTRGA